MLSPRFLGGATSCDVSCWNLARVRARIPPRGCGDRISSISHIVIFELFKISEEDKCGRCRRCDYSYLAACMSQDSGVSDSHTRRTHCRVCGRHPDWLIAVKNTKWQESKTRRRERLRSILDPDQIPRDELMQRHAKAAQWPTPSDILPALPLHANFSSRA